MMRLVGEVGPDGRQGRNRREVEPEGQQGRGEVGPEGRQGRRAVDVILGQSKSPIKIFNAR